jgi:bacillithiol biosynthesis deacetylase BshB1
MAVDILAIGAHPDDIELTCAGTLIKYARMGYKIALVDLTEGELGTRGTRAIRAREAAAAAKVIGAVRENLHLPDGNIEVSHKNMLKVVQAYRKYRPTYIFIPHSSDRHPDHIHAHHLCREAWFYAGLRKIQTKSGGRIQEPWRPKAYFHFMQWFEFTPSFIIDVTDVYPQRLKAIKAYASQFFDPTSKEPQTVLSAETFMDFLETRAKQYGAMIGVKYGEPFYTDAAVGIGNIFEQKFYIG